MDGLEELALACVPVTGVCTLELFDAVGSEARLSSTLNEPGSVSEGTSGTSSCCSEDMSTTRRILAVNFLYETVSALKVFRKQTNLNTCENSCYLDRKYVNEMRALIKPESNSNQNLKFLKALKNTDLFETIRMVEFQVGVSE